IGTRLPALELPGTGANVLRRPEWEADEAVPGALLVRRLQDVARQRRELVVELARLRVALLPADNDGAGVRGEHLVDRAKADAFGDAKLARGIHLRSEDEVLGDQRLTIVPGEVWLQPI